MTLPAGWKPDPVKAALGDEKFLWKHELTRGFFRQHVVGMLAVTDRRVIAPGAEIPLQDIDAIVARNKREVTKHSGTIELRPEGQRYGKDEIEIETESRVIGDVAFIRDGVPVIVFENLRDPDYLVGLATAAKDHLLGIIRSNARDTSAACPKCGRESPRGSAFCGHCGASLS